MIPSTPRLRSPGAVPATRSPGRALLGLAVPAFAVLSLASSSTARGDPARAHPYFDDHGTLTWFEDLGAAQKQARASSKAIFIEYGRKACGNCRVLVSCLLPNPAVAARMTATFVGLASDADDADPRIDALFARHLPDANMLPFVAVVSPDLRWITGWCGCTDVSCLSKALCEAESDLAHPASAVSTVAAAPTLPGACLLSPPPAATPAPASAPAGDLPPPVPFDATLPITTLGATGPDPAFPRPAVPDRTVPDPTVPDPAAPGVATPDPGSRGPTGSDGAPALLAAAKAATTAERFGEVIRLYDEAARIAKDADTAEIDRLAVNARRWARDSLDAVAKAAMAGRLDEATILLDRVEKTMKGLPAAQMARHGRAALATKKKIDDSSSSTSEKELARKAAAAAYVGTRWESLFDVP